MLLHGLGPKPDRRITKPSVYVVFIYSVSGYVAQSLSQLVCGA